MDGEFCKSRGKQLGYGKNHLVQTHRISGDQSHVTIERKKRFVQNAAL